MENSIVINDVKFDCPVLNNQIFVPIKPVCEALGIAHQPQYEVIKNDEIMGATVTINVTVGGDEKQRDMLCLPLKYALGWLMGIDSRKVKPEAKEVVLKYKNAAYDALYDKFYLEPALHKTKLLRIVEKENEILRLKNDRKELNDKIKEQERYLEQIKNTDPTQLNMFALN